MSAINIDLIYGNQYYKPKVDKDAGSERRCLEQDLQPDCPSDPGKRVSQKGGDCVRQADTSQGRPLQLLSSLPRTTRSIGRMADEIIPSRILGSG